MSFPLSSKTKYWFALTISILATFVSANSSAGPASRYTKPFQSVYIMDMSCAQKIATPAALSTSGVKISNAYSSGGLSGYQTTLASGVFERAKALGAGDLVSGTKVKVYDKGRPDGKGGRKCSSAAPGNKNVHLSSCNGANSPGPIAHLAHELGHIAGQQDNNYGKYNGVKPKCTITTYCTHTSRTGKSVPHSNRNEEFAEVFALYMFAPARLKSTCPQSFDFMAQNIFKNDIDPQASCTGYLGGGMRTTASGEIINTDKDGNPATEFDRVRYSAPQSNSGFGQTGLLTNILNFATAFFAARQAASYNMTPRIYHMPTPALQDATREQPVAPWGGSPR